MNRTTLLLGVLLVLSSCAQPAPPPPMVTVTYKRWEEKKFETCTVLQQPVLRDGKLFFKCHLKSTDEMHYTCDGCEKYETRVERFHPTEQMPVAVFDVRMTHDKAFRDSVLSFQ